MNSRMTLGLLAILAVLAVVVYFTEGSAPAADNATPQPEVLRFATSDAQLIAVESEGRTLEIVRQDGSWRITKPIEDRAEDFQVNGLVDRLSNLNASRQFDVPLDGLNEYGLATPKTSVRIQLSNGSEVQFQLGERTPDGSGYYVKVADRSPIYVVSTIIGDDLKRMVNQPPRALPTNTPAPTIASPDGTQTPTP